MKFDGFDWDEGNVEKVRKHGIEPSVVEIFFKGKVWIETDFKHSHYEDRFRAIGRLEARYIFVVFAVRENGSLKLIRPISARLMHKKEIAKYEKEITEIENR